MRTQTFGEQFKQFFRGRKAAHAVRILSVDGGGVRGLLPAMALAELEKVAGRPVNELFDLIVGTSTGALLALALRVPDLEGKPRFTAQELVRFYEIGAPRVFSRSMWHQIRAVGNLVDEKYPASGLEQVIARVFEDVMLSEALGDVMVTCYEVQQRRPFYFRARDAKAHEDSDFSMVQVVRAAPAAPTYFEPALVKGMNGHDSLALIDGAVVAYNPALVAYVEARRLYPEAQDFTMVSLGTGQLTRGLPYAEVKDWGAARWAVPLFSLMCDGDAVVVDQQLRDILRPGPDGTQRYFRIQPRLEIGSDDMDDASNENIRLIKQLGESTIASRQAVFEELAERLKR